MAIFNVSDPNLAYKPMEIFRQTLGGYSKKNQSPKTEGDIEIIVKMAGSFSALHTPLHLDSEQTGRNGVQFPILASVR